MATKSTSLKQGSKSTSGSRSKPSFPPPITDGIKDKPYFLYDLSGSSKALGKYLSYFNVSLDDFLFNLKVNLQKQDKEKKPFIISISSYEDTDTKKSFLLIPFSSNKFQIINLNEASGFDELIDIKNAREEANSFFAHEFKNRMYVLQILLKLISQDLQAGNFEKIKQNLSELKSTFSELYNFSLVLLNAKFSFNPKKLRVSKVENFDKELETQLNVFKKLFEKSSNRKLLINYSKPEKMPFFYANKSLLLTALISLIENSIKYHDSEKEYLRLDINISAQEKNIIFKIRDNGIGIHEKSLPNIFKKNVTSKTTGTSFGLGLFLVKKIVEAHTGKIDVESELGKGTTFIITIPREPNIF